MVSLYLNIQHHKGTQQPSHHGIGSAYGRQPPQHNGHHAGLVNGGVADTGGLVEMGKLGGGSGKRGSKKSKRRGSSSGGGGYARVNADANWEGGGRGGLVVGNGGVYGMDSEEEVDLGLVSVYIDPAKEDGVFFTRGKEKRGREKHNSSGFCELKMCLKGSWASRWYVELPCMPCAGRKSCDEFGDFVI